MFFSRFGALGRRKWPATSDPKTNRIAVAEKSSTFAKWKGIRSLENPEKSRRQSLRGGGIKSSSAGPLGPSAPLAIGVRAIRAAGGRRSGLAVRGREGAGKRIRAAAPGNHRDRRRRGGRAHGGAAARAGDAGAPVGALALAVVGLGALLRL